MTNRPIVLATALLLLLSCTAILAAGLAPQSRAAATSFGKLPLAFEKNEGQSDPAVRFFARGTRSTLFLTSSEAVLALGGSREKAAVVHMRLAGAKRQPKITPLEPQDASVNYFVGDASRWRRDVHQYAKIEYSQVYPGIDVVYHGRERQLEYDFVIAPGADPSRIELAFDGIDKLSIDGAGNLVLSVNGREIVQRRPEIYQQVEGARSSIDGAYVLRGRKHVSFKVAAYDRTRTLVIDPVITYSTYLGGSGPDAARAIAVDANGNAYIAGYTRSTNFPVTNAALLSSFASTNGQSDAFVAKLNAAGNALVYCTYLGGSDTDDAFGLAVDANGNAVVTGYTNSANFPTRNAVQPAPALTPGCQPVPGTTCTTGDVFVTKLNATGDGLIYSTYLGGIGSDQGTAAAVDASGNAFILGSTNSPDFPTLHAFQAGLAGAPQTNASDAIVAKLSADGTLMYSTYLGGKGDDMPSATSGGIAVDGNGNAYVAGFTNSADFPVANAAQSTFGGSSDAFLTKLNSAGDGIVFSSFLGGSDVDIATSIALDGAGNAYIAGYTSSTDLPTSNAFQSSLHGNPDAFVAKYSATGSQLFSTYLGGRWGGQHAFGIAVDGSGNIYVAGDVSTNDFPVVNSMKTQPIFPEAFVTKFNPSATSLIYSTLLGGNTGNDVPQAIALDGHGNAYIAGYTDSSDYPVVGGVQSTAGAYFDAFVTKIADAPKGDANGDGQVGVSDVFYLINALFEGGNAPVAGDANGDGAVNAADVFYLINYVFAGGPAPR